MREFRSIQSFRVLFGGGAAALGILGRYVECDGCCHVVVVSLLLIAKGP